MPFALFCVCRAQDKTEEMVSEIRRENKAKKTIAINSEDDLEKTRQVSQLCFLVILYFALLQGATELSAIEENVESPPPLHCAL